MRFFGRIFTLVITLFFLLFCSNLAAQQAYTRNITIKNGLPSNKVYDIFKDSRGYIWIGTDAGLCKFDGINYKTYTKSDGLAGNRIWSIAEDTIGNLWFACYGSGLSVFDGSKFKNFYVKDGLVNENIRKIEFSKKHKGILIGTINGFSFYRDSAFVSFKDTINHSTPFLQVTSFLEVDSLVYLLTFSYNKYFVAFNPSKNTFKYLSENHKCSNGPSTSTIGFIASNKDTILGNAIYGVMIFTKDSLIDNNRVGQVFDIVEDKSGDLWMASWSDGLSSERRRGGVYRLKNNKEERYSDRLGITTQECWCLLYDKEENLLWIGTLDKGIFQYPMTGIEILPSTTLNPSKPEINDYFIDSRGNAWVSVGDKILINGKINSSLQYKRFLLAYRDFTKNYYGYLLDKEGSCEKYKMLKDNGITKLNPYSIGYPLRPKGSLYNPNEFKTCINRRITDFYRFHEDFEGNIWIGSNLGLFCYYRNQDLLQCTNFMGYCNVLEVKHEFISILAHYQIGIFSFSDYNYGNMINVRKNPTWSSNLEYIKDNDCFWIFCNSDGLFKYKNNTLTRFSYLSNHIDIDFNALCKDSLGHLIAGTNTGRIYILDQINDSIKVSYSITEKDGIIGSGISWLLIDLKNRLWFATNRGLHMLNLERLYKENKVELSYYNQESGFFDNSTYKAMLDKSGRIIAVSKDNVITISPDILVQSTKKPKIVLGKIEVNYKEIDWSGTCQTDKWTGLPIREFSLPHTSNTISFYFNILQYSEPLNTRYSYKLEGVQKDWSPFTIDSKVILTNLSPDKYKLIIRGALLSNPNSIAELEINFIIRPPWWKTWWFYGIITMFLLVIGYIIFKNRERQAKEKANIEQRISELKLEALKSQMNPHFIFNAFTSIQLYILKNDTKNALEYMNRFAFLIRKTLENSTQKIITLTEEIDFLENYIILEQRRNTNLYYTFEVELEIDTDSTFLPPMLIQPLIENAIMHGIRHLEGDGLISIEFKKGSSNFLKCIVEDNGIGRTKAKEIYASQQKTHNSKSTAITTERIKLLNASNHESSIDMQYIDLYKDGKATGTRVELLIAV